jgi:plastocyanin
MRSGSGKERMRNRRRWKVLGAAAAAALAVLAFAACGGDDGGGDSSPSGMSEDAPNDAPAAEATDEVNVADFQFEPKAVEVDAGTELTWTNSDGFDHQVTVRDGGFESDAFGEGESVSTTFDTAGEYEYFCGIHNSMTGTITVT